MLNLKMKNLTWLIPLVVLCSSNLPFAYASDDSVIAQGKEIAFDRKKGNCLACHIMDDGELAGVIGPPLVSMQARYPDKAKLRDQIWDATARNPQTSMPPFGRHRMLTEEEIDKVVEYVNSL
ncbi:MAG: sulfur oxidation c-type cytochrome SoxX [Gammaproteobacteria bacterium]